MNLNGEQILEFIPEPALVIDNAGMVISANEFFLSQYSVKRRIFSGGKLSINELIKFDNIEDLHLHSDAFKETGFTILPSAISGTCLLGSRKIDDQYILVLKDNSVEVQLHNKYQKQLDELEEYSKGLEEKVRIRTRELSESNQYISGMLDSLHQAILVLNSDGKCLPHHNTNCASIFKTSPEGKSFWDIIEVPVEEQTFLKRWISHLIKEKINFEDIAELGPQIVIKDGTHIELKYFPLRSEKLTAEGVVVVARDITRLVKLEAELHTTEEFEKVLTKVATNLFIYRSAVEEQELALKALILATVVDEKKFKKGLHRLKGSYSLFSMHGLEMMTHQVEDLHDCEMPTWKSAFINLSEETKALHVRLANSLSLPPTGSHVWVNQEKIKSMAAKVGLPYSDELLAMTTMRLDDYITSYSSFADELCSQLKKKIHGFTVTGPELPAHPKVVRSLQPILTLYFRNVVDHGFWIEDEKKNSIAVNFERIDNRLKLKITDTGRGLRAKIQQTPNLISGRGLGMQIIKEQLKDLNGFHEQTFTDEGCVLLMEMDWPTGEN
jgi:two-component sensor histidine kinase/PAS domain-containing protein